MRRSDRLEDHLSVPLMTRINRRWTWRVFRQRAGQGVEEATRITVGVERFTNAGLNAHFDHSHFLVFKKKLVILWSGHQSVVFWSPPLVEVARILSQQESR